MRVVLVVKVINDYKETVGGYAHELELPFVPTVGMKFKQGTSTWLWEVEDGELEPEVKEVVYNIDEEAIYCLFEINQYLKSSFWHELPTITNSFELSQFRTHY
jgi:hypothetical protein